MAKRRRKKQSTSPFLIVGLVAAVIILVMGFLILNKNNAVFGPAKTDQTSVFTLPDGTPSDSISLITSPTDGDARSSSDPLVTDGQTPPSSVVATPVPTKAPVVQTQAPVQPVTQAPATAPPTTVQATLKPTEPPPSPTPQQTAAPTSAGPLPVPLPLYYGRILPENEPMIIRDATPAQYTGAYVGQMVVSEKNLTALELSDAYKTKMATIAAEAGKVVSVDGSLSSNELIIVAGASPLTRSDGTIRRVPMNVNNGEILIPVATPYIPGADAQIKVYFMAENVINYVYSERVVADADVLAWFEVRIEIVKTG